uniref:Ribonuclease H-like domain-containing protein n=1 Tax=Tanacetum cinerariifolium TaxID=118510 RepID=A0A699IM56_TANCI|nr:ribonuclease H-like domain-containing protein [Tanacetum cinerariifolium]
MVTRAQVGTVKTNLYFHGHTSPIFPIPKSPSIALSYPNWQDAMYDKYNALIKNSTWVLVLKPPNVNVVRSMWLFRHKYHAHGSLSRYKARLVANGRGQQFSVDCDDSFSHIVKPATIYTVLSLALSQNWHIHQLDVKNAFFNDDLFETMYMFQPPRFVDARFSHHLLDEAYMANCNPNRMPVDTKSKLGSDKDPISDPTLYRNLAAKRQHTLSRSSAEAEYRGVSIVVVETVWLRNLLIELHTPLLYITLVYCDNVHVLYVPSRYQCVDILTKGLPYALFEEFRTSLSVRPSSAQTTRAY